MEPSAPYLFDAEKRAIEYCETYTTKDYNKYIVIICNNENVSFVETKRISNDKYSSNVYLKSDMNGAFVLDDAATSYCESFFNFIIGMLKQTRVNSTHDDQAKSDLYFFILYADPTQNNSIKILSKKKLWEKRKNSLIKINVFDHNHWSYDRNELTKQWCSKEQKKMLPRHYKSLIPVPTLTTKFIKRECTLLDGIILAVSISSVCLLILELIIRYENKQILKKTIQHNNNANQEKTV